jgi:hypothetical protein
MNRMRIKVVAVLLMGLAVMVFQIGSVHAQGRKGRILALVSQGAKPYQDALAGFREQFARLGIPIRSGRDAAGRGRFQGGQHR